MSDLRAAIDVGTNSTRLIVLDGDGGTVAREMRITRLGKGVDERGHLDDQALERTLDTIGAYRDQWRDLGVDDAAVRIGATSAVRDASDRDRFFDGVRELTGLEVDVLSGEEEAALSFLGATAAVDARRPVVVLDIGGGSTELVAGNDEDEVVASYSMQLGSVRLTERILTDDPPTREQIDAARQEVDERLTEADAALSDAGVEVVDAATLIAVAGTPTTVAALHLGLDTYEPEAIHGTVLPTMAAQELAGRLLATPVADRQELGPIQSGREDVIAGGALILAVVLERYGFPSAVISESDILNGLAMSVDRNG